ncbi:type VI secretion system protein TssA [Acidimangrovimonas sediminis]|uniref:type VI secretion system protein TssA n=1 Tax=Acidimangrovimonas sediminis TaxID=2056283 RepID=UPI000C7FC1B1|nr:type VI secretion system ImpA family N-terminal domain-containing protein [Acidimangrovimonas sediminis]
MYLDTLLTPLSEDAPCGPDLEAADDDAFLDYYFEALARLPERYFDATGDAFDRKTIDLKAERTELDALLGRSRDLRLLSLAAQFNILCADLTGFVDCLCTMAALLDNWPAEVHPGTDEDATDRRNAIEMLDTRATVALPLEYAPLFRDRRAGEVSFNAYAVATGQRPPRGEEVRGDPSTLSNAFKAAENAAAVEAAHARLTDAANAVKKIKTACFTADRNPFGPTLDNLEATLSSLLSLLSEMRPDLGGASLAPATETDEKAAAGGDEGAAPTPAPPAAAAAPPPGPVASHAAAAAALDAVEAYFVRREPSSPALFLVHQSRQLIGRPLVEALRLLLPEKALEARIDFGADTGFVIGMDRMSELSELDFGDPDGEAAADAPQVTSRDHAQQLMSAVEAFFRQVEPSSPIPVLLFRAKTYLSRDFSAIIADLIPPPPPDPYA